MDRPIDFDIRASSLSSALFAFSASTGIEILVDARQVAGQRIAGIRGLLAPRDALEILLLGSRLVPVGLSPGTIALKADPSTSPFQTSTSAVSEGGAYFANIQLAVLRALCNERNATPGGYRLALKMWIGRSGTVLQIKRLDTTGNDGLDNGVEAAIRGLNIGLPPPQDLSQPVAIIISPTKTRDPAACRATAQHFDRVLTR